MGAPRPVSSTALFFEVGLGFTRRGAPGLRSHAARGNEIDTYNKEMTMRYFRLFLILTAALSLGGPGAAWAEDTPTADFTDNGDGTVTHETTGLTWMRCAVGQSWTGSGCSGSARTTYTYDQAMALTQTYAGYSDWRLPTIAELHTIVERERYNPAINTEVFPGTPSVWFWSASVDAKYPNSAWHVNFGNGYDGNYDKNDSNAVRLVRGGQSLSLSSSNTPTSDFIDHGDGTVTHQTTGLTWMRCAVGQTWSGSSCEGSVTYHNWQDAVAMTRAFAGYSDWRLPTENELLTIADYSRYSPAINTEVFPNTPNDWFWSASVYADYPDYAWLVYFGNGSDSYYDKFSYYAVRLVRGGQSLALWDRVDLTVSLADSPDPVKPGANLNLTATVLNQGPAAADGVVLRFYLPPVVASFVSATTGCQYGGGLSVVCAVGDLAANATASRTLVVRVNQAGGLSAAVSAHGNQTDAQPDDNLARAVTTIKP
jgi:hypothetical protein